MTVRTPRRRIFPTADDDARIAGKPVEAPHCQSPSYRLAEQDMIEFNAGTHRDELRMAYGEFARLAEPIVRHFGEPVSA